MKELYMEEINTMIEKVQKNYNGKKIDFEGALFDLRGAVKIGKALEIITEEEAKDIWYKIAMHK